jgi:predicted kinase
MQTIYIPIGLPGCGKTTFFESKLKGKDIIRISADDIRFRLLNSEQTHIYFDETREKEVWDEYYRLINISFKNYQSVYCDCTNLTLNKRMKLYECIIQNELEYVNVVYLFFSMIASRCWENQVNRERKVEKKILDQMMDVITLPNLVERTLFNQNGFAKMIIITDINQIQTIELNK